jgi:hypothetical protein
MNDHLLTDSRFFLKNLILPAERTIRRKAGLITAGKVVVEQSFGFWISPFDTHHCRLIGGIFRHSFSSKPAGITRSAINQKSNRIREFRNSVYHSKPICFNENTLDCKNVENNRNGIYELLSWIDSDLTDYIEYFDTIDNTIKLATNI